MANARSAKKRMRQNQKARRRNAAVRSRTRSITKRAHQAIAGGEPTAAESVTKALRELDRAVSKGVLHRNNAAQRKRRLMKRLASQQGSS